MIQKLKLPLNGDPSVGVVVPSLGHLIQAELSVCYSLILEDERSSHMLKTLWQRDWYMPTLL